VLSKYLGINQVARLGTTNIDGTVHIVPIVFANNTKNIYFIVDKKRKSGSELRRISNIQRNGRATLLVDSYSRNWAKLSFVLIYLKAKVLGPGKNFQKEKSIAAELLKAKYWQYHGRTYFPDDIFNATVVRMTPARFYAWPKESALN